MQRSLPCFLEKFLYNDFCHKTSHSILRVIEIMASNADRKQRILEHVKKSSDSLKLTVQKSSLSTEAEEIPAVTPDRVPELPEPSVTKSKIEDRKRRILNHVSQSSGEFGSFSLSNESERKQIQEHLRKSLS
jgi:hypothetical protein